MNNDTHSIRIVGTKGMFYHGSFDRLWPFSGTAASSASEPPLDPNYNNCSHQVDVSDMTTNNATEQQQQQQPQLEVGESSCSIITIETMVQPQHFDAEYMCIDISSTTSCNNSSIKSTTTNSKNSGDPRVAAQVPTIGTKRSATRFNTFSCFQCNDMIHAIVSRSFYSLASISMIIMNKSIDKSYHHYVKGDLSILIIVFQSFVVLGCIESCRQCGRSSNTGSSTSTYATTTITTGVSATKSNQKRSSLVPAVTLRNSCNTPSLNYTSVSLFTGLFFSFMLVTGMMALHYNSLSMIIVSRNVANLVLMVGDYIAFRKPPDVYVAMIYNMLLAGAIIAALKQHSFSVTRIGLLWMMANCISTAGYILCMKHFITSMFISSKNNSVIPLTQHQLSSPPTSGSTSKITGMIYSIIFIHNALCIAFLLPAAYMMGEVSLFVESTAIHTTEYASKTIIAGVLCFIFNYALLNCVEQQSTYTKQHQTTGSTSCTSHITPHSQQNQRRPSISERRTKKILL